MEKTTKSTKKQVPKKFIAPVIDKPQCMIVCDDREDAVTRHVDVLCEVSFVIQRISVGDYSVLAPSGETLAVIERKTLEDFNASFKDGRHLNKQKLIDERAATGCRIIYIIEGDPFPKPTDIYSGIPYKFTESSIFHMMIRDNITVLRTRDTLGTAQTLVRFVQSMNTLCDNTSADTVITDMYAIAPVICGRDLADAANFQVNYEKSLTRLTSKHIKSDDDIVRELWSCFPGISVESASDFMNHWTVADIVCGRIPRESIISFRLPSGRLINKKVIGSLCAVSRAVELRMLSVIEGISSAMAETLINRTSLSRLLSYGLEISIEIVGKNSRRLGDKCAERIVKYFNYKFTPIQLVQPVPTDKINNDVITASTLGGD